MKHVEIEVKYEGYIKRQTEQIKRFNRMESRKISDTIDYHRINALSKEAREKLSKIRPESIGQASRISGVSPADISVLMVNLEKTRRDVPRETLPIMKKTKKAY